MSTDTAKGRYFAKKDGTYDEEAERLKKEEAAKNGIGPDDGDAKEGGKIFKAKCATCHTVNSGGPNLQGPNLYGIMDRVAGKVRRCSPNVVMGAWCARQLEVLCRSLSRWRALLTFADARLAPHRSLLVSSSPTASRKPSLSGRHKQCLTTLLPQRST